MLATEERLQIEQRPSDEVHARYYGNGVVELAPCRYCGRPTVENLAYSAIAGRRLGRCYACVRLLRGQPEPIAAEFWAKRDSAKTPPSTQGEDNS